MCPVDELVKRLVLVVLWKTCGLTVAVVAGAVAYYLDSLAELPMLCLIAGVSAFFAADYFLEGKLGLRNRGER